MNKALRTTLILAGLISAVANAPGLLLALGNAQGGDPAKAKTGAPIAPVDYYAYDYDYDTTPSDPGAWLDALFQASNEAPVASWHHTWTDFESASSTEDLSRFRRPAHWEPEGVLFAYLATFSDIGYSDLRENFASPRSGKITSARFGAFGGGAGSGVPEDPAAQIPDDPPDNDPPPPDYVPVPPPGTEQPDTDPPPVNPPPPVNVAEPGSMSLFAVGIAGLFMFGKRRRLSASVQGVRDRV